MVDRSSSCVFLCNRGPEGLTVLEIIAPTQAIFTAAADTILFDKTKFGFDTILNVNVSYRDGSSGAFPVQCLLTQSGNNVTITLPASPYGALLTTTMTYIQVIGTSRATHSTGGNRLFGAGQM